MQQSPFFALKCSAQVTVRNAYHHGLRILQVVLKNVLLSYTCIIGVD